MSEAWSEKRRLMAPRVAAVLYGVIAIVTADLILQPGKVTYAEAVLGALLIGFSMTVTHIFVKVVTKEAEIGAHLPSAKDGTIIQDSLFVMAFPAITVLVVAAAFQSAIQSALLLDAILYLGIVAVFIIGFLSSYVLDRVIRLALSRGGLWTLLILVLLAAKALVLMY
jgi:hypothetical protein